MQMKRTILENWRRAAIDLNFEFISPFLLESDNARFECFGLVPQFGWKNGQIILVDSVQENTQLAETAQLLGYGWSCLYGYDSPYDIQDFVDTLNDWGWNSTVNPPPSWYSGYKN
jgi:hypothetical protein